jgi:hypothetical protein
MELRNVALAAGSTVRAAPIDLWVAAYAAQFPRPG